MRSNTRRFAEERYWMPVDDDYVTLHYKEAVSTLIFAQQTIIHEMFFDGDLRSGITAALQQDKSVACFVRDDGEESNTWEDEFLKDSQIDSLLATKAIVLRLQAGTQEAGYLAEIYPLPKTPTLVIILKGELKGYLVSGISKDDFIRRTKEALDSSIVDHGASNAHTDPTVLLPESSGSQAETSPAQTNPRIQAFLEERKLRMEAEKKAHDAKLKAEKVAADALRLSEIEENKPPDPRKEENRKYAAQQSKRQKEAREERERILRLVEDDKVARKEREALRREQARATAMIEDATSLPAESSGMKQPAATRSAHCAVQVRLFDGSTIRSRFPSNQTLRKEVRAWVDEQRRDDDTPYTFKQVLTPLPNRTLGDSEEDESLHSIGLCPSATLILVEVKDFTEAYQGNAAGLVRSSISTGYGIVSSGLGLVTGALGGIFGAVAPQAVQPQAQPLPTSTSKRRPQAQSSDERHEFYNGNSTNFEPRRDDVKKDD